MSTFDQETRNALLEPLQGLTVDPTQEKISMTGIDTGAAGKTASGKPDLTGAYSEFGQKIVDRAYARGWRPKEEHQGNPDNWIDPIEFFDRYAETSDRRAEKAAERKISALSKVVEGRMKELGTRIDRIDETDRVATEEYYEGMIAKAAPKDVPKLLKDRDGALQAIDRAKSIGKGPAAPTAKGGGDDILPETMEFFEKFPNLLNPATPDDVSTKAWAGARAAELEAKYPQATPGQIFGQITAELERKTATMSGTTTKNGGRSLSDGGGSSSRGLPTGGKLGPSDLSTEEKSAFSKLVDIGAYKQADIQKYCDDLAITKAEEAMSNGNR